MESILFFVFISLIGLSSQAEWSYDYESRWPGVCTTGQLQSPINIMTWQTQVDIHGAHIRGDLNLRGYSDVRVSGENNGHTLKWSAVPGTPAPVLSGGPLRGNYTFLQFHLHWLSEHAINGRKYPMEIHMVHVKTGIHIDEALQRPDGLAVVGVMALVDSDESSKRSLEQIMPDVPNLTDRTTGKTDEHQIDIGRFMSPDPQSYYTYHGSLTTPDCHEVVTWIVMDKPIMISDEQYKEFSKVDIGRIDNYRRLQPVNRIVYRSIASCSSIIAPSVFGTMIALLSCLTSTLGAGVSKTICLIGNIKSRVLGRKAIKECAKFA